MSQVPQAPHVARSLARFARRAACAAVAMLAIIAATAVFAAESPDLGPGDAHYAARRGTEARAAWLEALAAAPANPTLLCRLAQVESELSEDAKG